MVCVRFIVLILLVNSCSCSNHGNKQLQHHLADLLTRLTQLVDKYEEKSDQMNRVELLIRCHPPSTLVNGVITETVVDEKLILKFSCDNKGQLEGSEVIECNRGVWNGSLPTCKPGCEIPEEVASIVSDKSVTVDGQVEARFSCPKGVSLQGSNFLTCGSSGWNSSFPCCYTLKVGDQVRVKPSVSSPHYAWGKADHDSVGPITKVEENKVIVKFPKQSGWMARPDEMELVPPIDCAAVYSIK